MRQFDNRVNIRIPIHGDDRINQMIDWCNDNVGENITTWEWSYVDDSPFNSDVNFYFLKPEMATIFSLRWS